MCSNHELQATLNSLGYLEDNVYYKSRDCLNGAKDLIRYMRRDDTIEKTIRRELLKCDIISNDLIPLIKTLFHPNSDNNKLSTKDFKKRKDDSELFDIVLRLLVNLTQSALSCFEEKMPDDKMQYNIFIEIDQNLDKCKEAFGDEQFLKILCNRLKDIVEKDWEDRPEEEELIAERILFLIRNILLIRDSSNDDESKTSDLNAHDSIVINLHKAKFMPTLTQMCVSNHQLKYTVNLLEIITLLLKEQSAEELAKVNETELSKLNAKRSIVEVQKDTDELTKLYKTDHCVQKHKRMRLNPRHSRFMGTYVANNVKSINDENKLIVHRHARTFDELLDDQSKHAIRKSKNRINLEPDETQIHHKSVLYVRVMLKKFCNEFMNTAYNTFLRKLKDLFDRKQLEDTEISYYYWLIQFLTEFNLKCDLEEQTKFDRIKETFSMEIFHSIEVYIQHCIEMMRMEKKETRLWSKRMHISLKCYKENLITLFVLEKKIAAEENKHKVEEEERRKKKQLEDELKQMRMMANIDTNKHPVGDDDEQAALADLAESMFNDESNNHPQEQQKSSSQLIPIIEQKRLLDERSFHCLERLKEQIFYIQEFRELFLLLLRDFDQAKMSKNFLRDLIEANHIFLSMLEMHMTKNSGQLSVQCKKPKRKPKALPLTKEEREQRKKQLRDYKLRVQEQTAEFKQNKWQANLSRVIQLLHKEVEFQVSTDDLMPFDFVATSDQELDSHKIHVSERIQHFLSENKPDDSIALFREARCLWPNDTQFGKSENTGRHMDDANEEFEVYKTLYMQQMNIEKPVMKRRKQLEDLSEKKDDKKEEEKREEGHHEEEEEEIVDDEEEQQFKGSESEEDEDEKDKYQTTEENLDFKRFLFRYTNAHVFKCFILMFGDYSTNADFINRCCMQMFERLAYDCLSPQCLYQLSLFTLINKIYKDPAARCILMNLDVRNHDNENDSVIQSIYSSKYSIEDMFAFFRQLLATFFEKAKQTPTLFLELPFFKSKNLLQELGEDDEDHPAGGHRNEKGQSKPRKERKKKEGKGVSRSKKSQDQDVSNKEEEERTNFKSKEFVSDTDTSSENEEDGISKAKSNGSGSGIANTNGFKNKEIISSEEEEEMSDHSKSSGSGNGSSSSSSNSGSMSSSKKRKKTKELVSDNDAQSSSNSNGEDEEETKTMRKKKQKRTTLQSESESEKEKTTTTVSDNNTDDEMIETTTHKATRIESSTDSNSGSNSDSRNEETTNISSSNKDEDKEEDENNVVNKKSKTKLVLSNDDE